MSTRMLDALALIGDTSDNVPGVKGIGDKTAAQLLRDHGSLAALRRPSMMAWRCSGRCVRPSSPRGWCS